MHKKVSGGLKRWKVDGSLTTNLPIIQATTRLFPLALNGNYVDFEVKHNETPQLIELIVHPELFRFGEFLLHVHDLLLFGNQFPTEVALELPEESVMKHELHPRAA